MPFDCHTKKTVDLKYVLSEEELGVKPSLELKTAGRSEFMCRFMHKGLL